MPLTRSQIKVEYGLEQLGGKHILSQAELRDPWRPLRVQLLGDSDQRLDLRQVLPVRSEVRILPGSEQTLCVLQGAFNCHGSRLNERAMSTRSKSNTTCQRACQDLGEYDLAARGLFVELSH